MKASNGLIDLSSGETVGHEANRMDWMLASSIASASDLSLYNKGHAVDTMNDGQGRKDLWCFIIQKACAS